MNRYMLNVGLLESKVMADGRAISAAGALTIVRDMVESIFDGSAVVMSHAVHTSDSEPTLVVEIRTAGPRVGRMAMLAEILCSRLRQEAIAFAALLPSGAVSYGMLRGPMAHRWGDFNPEFFLLLNGERAAAAQAVAA